MNTCSSLLYSVLTIHSLHAPRRPCDVPCDARMAKLKRKKKTNKKWGVVRERVRSWWNSNKTKKSLMTISRHSRQRATIEIWHMPQFGALFDSIRRANNKCIFTTNNGLEKLLLFFFSSISSIIESKHQVKSLADVPTNRPKHFVVRLFWFCEEKKKCFFFVRLYFIF